MALRDYPDPKLTGTVLYLECWNCGKLVRLKSKQGDRIFRGVQMTTGCADCGPTSTGNMVEYLEREALAGRVPF